MGFGRFFSFEFDFLHGSFFETIVLKNGFLAITGLVYDYIIIKPKGERQ